MSEFDILWLSAVIGSFVVFAGMLAYVSSEKKR